jgi:DNA-binding GntR family transcriptional regulator
MKKSRDKISPRIQQERVYNRLREIDHAVNRSIDEHDVQAYISGNYRFHFTLYGYGNSEVALPLIESLWMRRSMSICAPCVPTLT